ncbi:MaoC/PaaZ C-terminal domain-containing protein [Nocardioides marmorisolisilvae]|uniref:Acyl dehydratase n=1 Tax=Nocardioides marmorisolisilvae TaxID=1542737 RepID=A0A3N0DZS6_9ACTN|nr:MaoC/PaaZ C-terminal domain-containing protein [Nocardioides marmorisolisilvae]RNL81071.1 acyl dehydratase [Nocardioides marmorisolisilvae]
MDARTYRVTRADLVAYAAASGDHNPIHQDEAVALSVGLPGVIAHGMYTLALVARYVDESVGHSGQIAELTAKFTKPVVVPAEGVEVVVEGELTESEGQRVVALTVTCNGEKVLGNPRAVLRA